MKSIKNKFPTDSYYKYSEWSIYTLMQDRMLYNIALGEPELLIISTISANYNLYTLLRLQINNHLRQLPKTKKRSSLDRLLSMLYNGVVGLLPQIRK
jgi:hypothetical protein